MIYNTKTTYFPYKYNIKVLPVSIVVGAIVVSIVETLEDLSLVAFIGDGGVALPVVIAFSKVVFVETGVTTMYQNIILNNIFIKRSI